MEHKIVTERSDVMEANIMINMVFTIQGELSDQQMIQAITAAFQENESTMSKIVIDKEGNAYYQRLEETQCRIIQTEKKYEDVIAKYEKIPFAIDRGELLRVFLIRHQDQFQILLMGHHLVGDGKSLILFMEDVMQQVQGEKTSFQQLYLLDDTTLPRNSRLPMLLLMYTKRKNRQWNRIRQIFGFPYYYELQRLYWSERQSKVHVEHFTKQEVDQLHRIAKANGISMTSLFAGAFLQADDQKKKQSVNIGIPVDVRPQGNRSMSNQVSGISIASAFGNGKDMMEQAKVFHKKMQTKLRHPKNLYFILRLLEALSPSLIDSRILYVYKKYRTSESMKVTEPVVPGIPQVDYGITNLGKLEMRMNYGTYSISDVIFIPPAISYTDHVIGVVTFEDGMNFTYHQMLGTKENGTSEFFQRAMKLLHESASMV